MVNPRSAAAHFELGCLYDQEAPDPVAAIYHYEQYLKLDPNAGNADVIRGRIEICKQNLAKNVMALPSTSIAQQQLEKLVEQNRQLQAQVDHLNDVVKQWNAYYASQLAATRTNVTPTPEQSVSTPQPPNPARAAQPVPSRRSDATLTRSARMTPRTHSVVSGETAVGIARRYGIPFEALRSANPRVNLGRIRAGQTLNLPPP